MGRTCCEIACVFAAMRLVDQKGPIFATCTEAVLCDSCGRTLQVTYWVEGVPTKTMRLVLTPQRIHLASCSRVPGGARVARTRLAPLLETAARDAKAPQPAACCLRLAWRAYLGVRP